MDGSRLTSPGSEGLLAPLARNDCIRQLAQNGTIRVIDADILRALRSIVKRARCRDVSKFHIFIFKRRRFVDDFAMMTCIGPTTSRGRYPVREVGDCLKLRAARQRMKSKTGDDFRLRCAELISRSRPIWTASP